MICLRCRTRCKMISTHHLNIVAAIVLFQSLADMVVAQQCGSHYSIFGMMLRGHTFKTLNTSIPFECNQACNGDIRCRSFNYVIKKNVCELNNRAKEARPEDFVPDQHRYYFRRNKEMVPLGSIPELPAESCAEIYASEEGYAVSGSYWLKIKTAGMASLKFLVHCDMTPERQGWTLIARFSNKDVKHWMNDSGYWWYDKTEAAGQTTDPSTNADMISPAFWLASGNEFKITRSDDSQHTPLLQTTTNCLNGQTFRSKITSYGDFRNDKWSRSKCLGNCIVQYGGQYNKTEGFKQAECNGTMQSFNKIGFWCNVGWSSSVLMIGGGGNPCSGAGHGVGVTAAKSPHLVTEAGRPERDFANFQWHSITQAYSLNLWIRKT